MDMLHHARRRRGRGLGRRAGPEAAARALTARPAACAGSVVQRGFWVHGVDTLGDVARRGASRSRSTAGPTAIRCPTLLTTAENDRLPGAPALLDALACPKTLHPLHRRRRRGRSLRDANRSLANRRSLDWLDDDARACP